MDRSLEVRSVRIGIFSVLLIFVINSLLSCATRPKHSTYECLHMIYLDPRGSDGFDLVHLTPVSCETDDCLNEDIYGDFVSQLSDALELCQSGEMDFYWTFRSGDK